MSDPLQVWIRFVDFSRSRRRGEKIFPNEFSQYYLPSKTNSTSLSYENIPPEMATFFYNNDQSAKSGFAPTEACDVFMFGKLMQHVFGENVSS